MVKRFAVTVDRTYLRVTLATITTEKVGWNFDTTYLTLPAHFYTPATPRGVALPQLLLFNQILARNLGLNEELLAKPESALIFSGNTLPEGATTIAQAYAGHQFGHFTVLGDGRAILLGEQITPSGKRFDIQLKGPGQTPYSRRGDGRAALGPMLREYIISEAMHALGIPTTRSLAVVATGEPVYRENVLPGAILTRVAASHIRVGTFEFAAAQGDAELVRALADYTIARHYPDVNAAENPYVAFFALVADRQAELIAKWMQVGFIHGVMNTDNMSLAGETIDYGPCAFMDVYDPTTVFSSIDQQGRYAFGNQPRIASWNLARFAETLLPLFAAEEKKAIELAQGALAEFNVRFNYHWLSGMRNKLGLISAEDGDVDLITTWLRLLQENAADYTNAFRTLSNEPLTGEQFFQDAGFVKWKEDWQARLARQNISPAQARENMLQVNPAVIARNHKVEEALQGAEAGDMSATHALLQALGQPFVATEQNLAYRSGAPSGSEPYRTFCGT
jgi:serine/tyrosine/threonine adenylyltransferase